MVIGFVFIAASGRRPSTPWGWVLWSAAAPILALAGEAIYEGFLFLFSKIPPFSWLGSWVRCEDGDGDPLLRFVGLAFGFLALFFIAIHIIYDYP